MVAQRRTESTREIYDYGRFINQFPLNIIRSILQYEKINNKYIDKKCLLCSMKYVFITCIHMIYTHIMNSEPSYVKIILRKSFYVLAKL